MGWWNAAENKDISIGDEVLDLTRHFLKSFSKEYNEGLKRKPTAAELEYVLNLAFKVNVDDEILEQFNEQEIKQVILKVGKRPKRQKTKAGDLFAFKLDDGKFAFGRVVSKVSIGAVVELFDYFSDMPIFDYSKLGKWVTSPVTIDSYGLLDTGKDGDWRVIGHTDDFTPGEQFKNIRFVYGSPPHALTAVDIFDKEEPITERAAAGLPFYSARRDWHVKELLKEKLNEKR